MKVWKGSRAAFRPTDSRWVGEGEGGGRAGMGEGDSAAGDCGLALAAAFCR